MVAQLKDVKAVLLAGLILVGICVHHSRVNSAGNEVLTVAGGCFWCVESDFERVEGVTEVVSGYTGGSTENPTYKDVVRGGTGHYEAVQIYFDPTRVSRVQLLTLFFRSVDPTDPGGQFCDRGHSYRTAIFVNDDEERSDAQKVKADAQTALGQEIVTPILNFVQFYEAEEYHQNYYRGTKIVFTRFGPKSQAKAYKAYREACGRDARVMELWGAEAPFLTH